MVKKILLTIATLPAVALISFVAVIGTVASIFGGQTQYYDSVLKELVRELVLVTS